MHTAFKTAAIVFGLLFAISLILWIMKKSKFKQTEVWTTYKEMKASMKAAKKAEK